VRLRIGELLQEREMTAYGLAKGSHGIISLTTAYRLARGEWRAISGQVMDVLCDVLEVEPGQLFEREKLTRKRGR
jgi:DNA-binding Xre family transcriptional regulator